MNKQPSLAAVRPFSPVSDRIPLPLRGSWKAQNVVFALAVCLALQMTSFVMILPLFSRRFTAFGAGVEALSASALAYALTSTVAAPFMGALADRFGRRPLVLGPLAVYVLAFSGYLLAPDATWFIGLRGAAGAEAYPGFGLNAVYGSICGSGAVHEYDGHCGQFHPGRSGECVVRSSFDGLHPGYYGGRS